MNHKKYLNQLQEEKNICEFEYKKSLYGLTQLGSTHVIPEKPVLGRFIKSRRFLSAYQLIKIFVRIDQIDYRALPAQTSQQVILLLEKNWKSFFKANKKFRKNPNKFQSRPKLPKFKHKSKGKNIAIFTNQQCKLYILMIISSSFISKQF